MWPFCTFTFFFPAKLSHIITFGVPTACCGRNLPWPTRRCLSFNLSAAVRTQALELDFQAYLITDATKPVSEQQGASARAELQHLRLKKTPSFADGISFQDSPELVVTC